MQTVSRCFTTVALTLSVLAGGVTSAHAAESATTSEVTDSASMAPEQPADTEATAAGAEPAPDVASSSPPEPAPPSPSGLPPSADRPTGADLIYDAERARVVGKGKRLLTTGTVFTGVAMVGLAVSVVSSVRGNTGGAIVAAGASVVFAATGLALVVPGRRRMRTPERFMKTKSVAVFVAPVLTRQTQGAALAVRF